MYLYPELVGDDMRQGGFAQPRWPVEQNVVQGVTPLVGGLHGNPQLLLHLALPEHLSQGLGAKSAV